MLWGPHQWDSSALHRSRGGDEAASNPEQALQRILRKIRGHREMTVADLGCGSGRMIPFLSTHCRRVVAVDYAPATIALARKRHPAGNVEFRRRDLRDLTPFRRRFDVVVAAHSIAGPRRSDVDRVLDQVWRSLREGGLLLALFAAAERSGSPVPLVLGDAAVDPEPLRFLEAELQYRLRRVGFRGIRLRRFDDGSPTPTLLATAARRADN